MELHIRHCGKIKLWTWCVVSSNRDRMHFTFLYFYIKNPDELKEKMLFAHDKKNLIVRDVTSCLKKSLGIISRWGRGELSPILEMKVTAPPINKSKMRCTEVKEKYG